MRNIQLIISYDGSPYLGWQKTPLGPTIEETLENTLSQILQEKISLQAASRTDAKVHAEGQSVNFISNKEKICLEKLHKSLNALLPPSITVTSVEQRAPDFHPTLDAQGKEYHYLVCNTPYQLPKHRFFSWHVPSYLDIVAMKQAALSLLGTHDFSAFCNERSLLDKDPICTLHSLDILSLEGNRLLFSVKGNRFLYRMVRNLIGTLIYVGQGKISQEDVSSILSSKNRTLAGVTAPAHGLHLIQVFYAQPQGCLL